MSVVTKKIKKNIISVLVIGMGVLFFLISQEEKGFVIDPGSIVIDVRTDWEFKRGHLEGAINIPYQNIYPQIEEYTESKDDKIVLYCRSGRRSGIAEQALKKYGYQNAVNAGSYAVLKKMNEGK